LVFLLGEPNIKINKDIGIKIHSKAKKNTKVSVQIKAIIKNNSTKKIFIKKILVFISVKLLQAHKIKSGIVKVVNIINKIDTPSIAEVGIK